MTASSSSWRLEAVLERIEGKINELRAVRREVQTVMAACERDECVFAEPEGAA